MDSSEETPAAPAAHGAAGTAAETKVIYHVCEEETPYRVKVPAAPDAVTLADLKKVVKREGYKFFFKAKDDDFGFVKEEIVDDEARLPLFNGKVECYLELSQAGSVIGGASTAGGGAGGGALSSLQHHPGGGGGARPRVATSGRRREQDGDESAASDSVAMPPPGLERGPGVGETRPPSFHGGRNVDYPEETDSLLSSSRPQMPGDDFDDAESSITSVSQAAERRRMAMQQQRSRGGSKPAPLPGPGIRPPPGAARRAVRGGGGISESASMMSSDIESSVFDDRDSLASSSRFGTTDTEHTSVSRQAEQRQKRRTRRRLPAHHLARAGSMSSVTDSMTLDTITVTLNMDSMSFLGISIVGHSNTFNEDDCGIYVGSIMTGGAVAQDGRIQPGDMILQVNDISFESMSNDEAVAILREVVQTPGPIKLVVVKSGWDNPTTTSGMTTSGGRGGNFSVPRDQPVRPIDPGAWVAHIAACNMASPPAAPSSFGPGQHELHDDENPYDVGSSVSQTYGLRYFNYGHIGGADAIPASHFPTGPQIPIADFPPGAPSVTTLSASSVVSSQPETERYFPIYHPQAHASERLTTSSPMSSVVRAMRRDGSGLEVKERTWVGITIPDGFVGSEAVEWLVEHVEGVGDRKEAKKIATAMLAAGFIRHTMKKTAFKESLYYSFVDEALVSADMAALGLGGEKMAVQATTPRHHHRQMPPPSAPAPPIPWQQQPAYPMQQQPWQQQPPTAVAGPPPLTVGDQSIYNPAAPPPSANYAPYSYGDAEKARTGSDSGHSLGGSQARLRLAGSGSGSESDGLIGGTRPGVGGGVAASSSTLNSDCGFRARAQGFPAVVGQ